MQCRKLSLRIENICKQRVQCHDSHRSAIKVLPKADPVSALQNSIVVLPTGAGKTRIASEVASLCLARTSKSVLFLVPTCLLVGQQARSVRLTTGRTVFEFMGGSKPPKKDFEVLVSTPAAFIGLCTTSPQRFGLLCFGLVVFDEVHHVVKRHPYRKIARLLALIPSGAPQVMGLTASLTYAVGESRIQRAVEEMCEELSISAVFTATKEELKEGGYHAGEVTPQLGPALSSLSSCSSEKCESSIDVDISTDPSGMPPPLPGRVHEALPDFLAAIKSNSPLLHPITHALMAAVREQESSALRLDPAFTSPIGRQGKRGRVAEWGIYAHSKATKTSSNPNKEGIRVTYELLEHLYEAARLVVSSRQTALELAMCYLEMSGIVPSELHTIDTSPISPPPQEMTQKLRALVELWQQKKGEFSRLLHLKDVLLDQIGRFGRNLRCIVFCQQRLTTHILKYVIEQDADLAGLTSDVIYATTSPATARLSVSSRDAQERLAKFSSGELTILFSTAVAEEGMDVPEANCVVRFDAIQTPVSLVQSRGRARQEDSAFVIMQEQFGRGVATLAIAENQQAQVLQSIDLGDEKQREAIRLKRDQAIQSRQQNGLLKLKNSLASRGTGSNAKPNDISLVKMFAQWTATEIDERFKRNIDSNWVCHMKLLQPWDQLDGGIATEATGVTKKEASSAAAANILNCLKSLIK